MKTKRKRRLFCITLSICLTFLLCLGFVGCGNQLEYDEQHCTTHEWNLVSTTATCTENGTENFACKICGETKTEAVAAYGHKYNKNVCVRCSDTLTDLSQFSKSYRDDIAEQLLLIAPYITDSETFVAVTRLLKLYKDDIADCENRVDKAQKALEKAKNEATVRRYVDGTGWVWQADEKKVAAAEKDLKSAQDSLLQAQSNLKVCKVSYEFNSEAYAWNIAILGIKASDVSNYAVNYNLAELAALEMTALEITSLPSWYFDIIQNIQLLTGIDIRES